MKAGKPVNLEWVVSQNVKILILSFSLGWKINSKDEVRWVWNMLPNADVCVLNRLHQGQDNHLLSINKPTQMAHMAGKGTILEFPWFTMKVRKIKRWRSVIADWFSSNFEIWFIIAAWICGESHVRCSTSLNPFFEALTVDPSWSFFQEVHPRVITSSWHMQTLGTGRVGQIGGMVASYIKVKGDVIPKNHLVVMSNDWRKENIGIYTWGSGNSRYSRRMATRIRLVQYFRLLQD